MKIDIKTIRPYNGSTRDAFEEFVCQIVRRTDADRNETWRRLHGAGGDGGVEAYWHAASDGSHKCGLQAKYFTATSDIDWKQIIGSFRTALAIHPDLAEYRIYIACDLTGPTGRRGRSGTQLWDTALADMLAEASKLGRSVKVSLVTLSDLYVQLARPECVGLSEFWFGALEITPASVAKTLNSAILALGERYQPEDHVDVAAQGVVRALSRSRKTQKLLCETVDHVIERDRVSVPAAWTGDPALIEQIKSLNAIVDRLSDVKYCASSAQPEPWPVGAWAATVETMLTTCHALSAQTWRARESDQKDDRGLRSARHHLDRMSSALHALAQVLGSVTLRAEATRVVAIIGPAGCGKSHLLASGAEEIVGEGAICFLLLGHRFIPGDAWAQIAQQLGAPGLSKAKLLGAIDAAAAASNRRAVIIFDALNEGPLRTTWLRELDGFVADILAFPNLAVALSCRDVYEERIFSPLTLQQVPRLVVQGFDDDDAQEAAARIYLDGRGITRPAVPWLTPEFINPLFLRSCALALQAMNKKDFPVGLIGTKATLKFYLDAVARQLGTDDDGTDRLAAPVRSALLEIARAMASRRLDYLSLADAQAIVDHQFHGYTPPHGMSWLDVLLRNGVVREDPNPDADPIRDPLRVPADVIRFAFQRFQDHLITEALLESVTDVRAAFDTPGCLAFLFNPDGAIRWEWNGLLEALSIQVPERFGVELVDALPGDVGDHWSTYGIQSAFIESVKWRAVDKFSERTLSLASCINYGSVDPYALLIALSPRPDHPWNAELLDEILRRRPLPERDARWTRAISSELTYEPTHPLPRLIRWCETAPKSNVDPRVLFLSALCLTWSLSSSSRAIRDGATKALASLFSDREDLFLPLLDRFSMIDDVYILERLLAAAYGSLVRFISVDKARTYSAGVWQHVFAGDAPPADLLLRDYATGIIDIAEVVGGLHPDVIRERTRAPFKSRPPRLTVSKDQIEKIAERAGDKTIARSCGEHGDFHIYENNSRVHDFTTVPLSKPPPQTSRDGARSFELEVVQGDAARTAALEEIKRVIGEGTSHRVVTPSEGDPTWSIGIEVTDNTKTKEWRQTFRRAEKCLLRLLSPEEARRYRCHWRTHARAEQSPASEDPPRHHGHAASRWIAREAYRKGWTAKRFPRDHGHLGGDYSRNRPRIERIGKKYQWIARSELLARLADNYWLYDQWRGGAITYEKITDLAFERDIDPTIFGNHRMIDRQSVLGAVRKGVAPPVVEPIPSASRLNWPFAGQPASDALAAINFLDETGVEWLRLYWYASTDERTSLHHRAFGHNFARQHFYFLSAVLVPVGAGAGLMASLQSAKAIDIDDWRRHEFTDGPYLYEIAQRSTWPDEQWSDVVPRRGRTHRVAFPVDCYHWESHLDATMPDGKACSTPAAWIMRRARLHLDPCCEGVVLNEQGEIVAMDIPRGGTDPKSDGLLVRANWFRTFLNREALDCVWLLQGEKAAWNDGDREGARAFRVFNGARVLSDGRVSEAVWDKDCRRPAAD